MLGKLLKHEFRAANRLMVPLHLLLILITIAGRFYIQFVFSDTGTNLLDHNPWFAIISVSLAALYFIALLAVGIMTHLYLQILRPRKHLFTDEGYLTHTLPVTASAHIWSKLIVTLVWSVIDAVLITLSVLAMFINKGFLREARFLWGELVYSFPDAFGVTAGIGIPVFLLVTLLDTIAGILVIYMCMAIGHSFHNHKILASIGVFAGYVLVSNLISSIFVSISGSGFFRTTQAVISSSFSMTASSRYFWNVMLFGIIFSLILSIVSFVVTDYFLKKRLNLE